MMPSNLPLTVVDCGALTDPANGQVSHTAGTTFGETATYSCDAGYSLVGSSTRMCQATGMWSGRAPTCQGMLLLPTIKCACREEGEGGSAGHSPPPTMFPARLHNSPVCHML